MWNSSMGALPNVEIACILVIYDASSIVLHFTLFLKRKFINVWKISNHLFYGKVKWVFPIVINVSIQVSSAGKMLPWSRDIFICSLKCFRHNNYELKFSWIRKLEGNNCLVYSGDFIQRVSFSHSGYVIIYRANDTWEIAKWSNFYRYERKNVNSLEEESMSGVRIAQ